MPTFEQCPKDVLRLAAMVLAKHETHKPLLDAHVTLDLLFAYPDYDETTGAATNDALTHAGHKALGITRKTSLKDRVAGRKDAEICLDGEWWEKASDPEREALLDHELHHLAVKEKRFGGADTDDIGRPVLKLRKHDVQVGWFTLVASRNGINSMERKQAAQIMEKLGQYYFPEVLSAHTDVAEQSARVVRMS